MCVWILFHKALLYMSHVHLAWVHITTEQFSPPGLVRHKPTSMLQWRCASHSVGSCPGANLLGSRGCQTWSECSAPNLLRFQDMAPLPSVGFTFSVSVKSFFHIFSKLRKRFTISLKGHLLGYPSCMIFTSSIVPHLQVTSTTPYNSSPLKIVGRWHFLLGFSVYFQR